MPARIVTWSQDTANLGPAAVAVGVFDGVHVGHQALLADTVADARERSIAAVAVTFDRDPDQVVSPSTAAPQLLTLADKLDCIAETGVDVILVVPFTPLLAELAPESFVDGVLLSAMEPVSVHVGRDFRFGARAGGTVDTLSRLGASRGFQVRPHDLIESGGEPVTSTRIRGLVAAGDVAAAGELLCVPPRVSGTVHRGRGEGVKLGFPTANVAPVAFAALPADGVYAGRALLENGLDWAAAISVGTPPTFPEARDHLEAHLVDFEGDLYDQQITLEFVERLRDQQAYASLADLTAAIAADVEATLEIAGFDDEATDGDAADATLGMLETATDELVDDPAALDAAEDAARTIVAWPPNPDDELVVLFNDLPYDPTRLGEIDALLRSVGIEPVWSPYPPQDAVLMRLGLLGENRFRVEVWNSCIAEARAALQESDSAR
ncbi:MAG: riboflavin biosynthesis protein RibF [Coriobacteriia bacterium]|nr:riboflavin biosynthesis protein RibF [Coriobacteriia bacterium]